jgi:N-acetyl-anhydromuramyl-L-alanine amidase AmpD
MYAPDCKAPLEVSACHETLIQHHVSAHYYITPAGEIYQSIPDTLRAWHAGKSRMPFAQDTREAVNDFSIGIELIGGSLDPFPDAQYEALIFLTQTLRNVHPISSIVGHDQIAPDRKTDPGSQFNWKRVQDRFKELTFLK